MLTIAKIYKTPQILTAHNSCFIVFTTDIKQHNRTSACIYIQKNSIDNVAQNEQQTVFTNLHKSQVSNNNASDNRGIINCLLQDEQKVSNRGSPTLGTKTAQY